jgi:hypothetical protein
MEVQIVSVARNPLLAFLLGNRRRCLVANTTRSPASVSHYSIREAPLQCVTVLDNLHTYAYKNRI